jgi:capsid protein
MKRLYSLSDAQRARLSEWAQQWLAIGLSTEPADRPTFERAVARYTLSKGECTSRVIWTGSPLAVDLVMMHLTSNADTPEFDCPFCPRACRTCPRSCAE